MHETAMPPDRAANAREARRNRALNSVRITEIFAQNRLSGLEPARRSAVERRLSQMPKIYRRTYLLAVGGRSPKAAIKASCLECIGWQREEVARCTASACPLYAYRPFQR